MCKAEITQKVHNCTVYDGIQIQGYTRCQLERHRETLSQALEDVINN
jgi:hypothetical protein